MKFFFAWYDFWIGWFWDAKKCALYILPVPCFGVRIRIWGHRCYVVMKRGLFYRPKACGYTDRIEEAGRYTYAEAKAHEYPHDEPVTIAHVSKFITQ